MIHPDNNLIIKKIKFGRNGDYAHLKDLVQTLTKEEKYLKAFSIDIKRSSYAKIGYEIDKDDHDLPAKNQAALKDISSCFPQFK